MSASSPQLTLLYLPTHFIHHGTIARQLSDFVVNLQISSFCMCSSRVREENGLTPRTRPSSNWCIDLMRILATAIPKPPFASSRPSRTPISLARGYSPASPSSRFVLPALLAQRRRVWCDVSSCRMRTMSNRTRSSSLLKASTRPLPGAMAKTPTRSA